VAESQAKIHTGGADCHGGNPALLPVVYGTCREHSALSFEPIRMGEEHPKRLSSKAVFFSQSPCFMNISPPSGE